VGTAIFGISTGKRMSAFTEVARGHSNCCIEAAFELCLDEYPNLNLAEELAKLRELAVGFDVFRTLHLGFDADVEHILDALNEYFFGQLGFSGAVHDYYDPRNSYLSDVLARRAGIPITLSLLYKYVARHVGIELVGINLPGHFMLAYESLEGSRRYVDVFNGGTRLDWDACVQHLENGKQRRLALREHDFPAMTDCQLLTRLLRNLKGIYFECDPRRALRVQERLVQLVPEDPSEQRDLGLLYSCNGKPMNALKALQELIRKHPSMGHTEVVQDGLRLAAREAALAN
jgi:regulator of sirC expression with transglutaminase-like and TPR domain